MSMSDLKQIDVALFRRVLLDFLRAELDVELHAVGDALTVRLGIAHYARVHVDVRSETDRCSPVSPRTARLPASRTGCRTSRRRRRAYRAPRHRALRARTCRCQI